MQFLLMGLGAIGKIVEGVSSSAMLKEQERVDRLNAEYARENARINLRTATLDAEKTRREGRRVTAEQTAGFAQSGFGMGGSAALSVQDSAVATELDALTDMYHGELRARQDRIAAVNYEAKANAARSARRAIPLKTALGVGTSLLQGYSKYHRGAIA